MNFLSNCFVESFPSYDDDVDVDDDNDDDDAVGLSRTSGWEPMPCAMSFLAIHCKTQCWQVTTPHENAISQSAFSTPEKALTEEMIFRLRIKRFLRLPEPHYLIKWKLSVPLVLCSPSLIPSALSSWNPHLNVWTWNKWKTFYKSPFNILLHQPYQIYHPPPTIILPPETHIIRYNIR